MIDIIGFISVDETKKERIDYLISCIRSYAFLKDRCKFILALANPSDKLMDMALAEMDNIGFDGNIARFDNTDHYGLKYLELLKKGTNDYVLNFMEDQFMVCDKVDYLDMVISTMKKHRADVCKSSFLSIEQNSSRNLVTIQDNEIAKVFVNHDTNFARYKDYYGNRYYIGVNFLTTRKFAEKFWARELGPRPHEYEVQGFDENWVHTCVIPKQELQAAIDDDHGDPNSCLLNRGLSDAKIKFNDIYRNLWVAELTAKPPNKENAPPADQIQKLLKNTLNYGAEIFLKGFFYSHNADKRMRGMFICAGENLVFYASLPVAPIMDIYENDTKTLISTIDKITKLPNYQDNIKVLGNFTPGSTALFTNIENNKLDFIHIESPNEFHISNARDKLKPGGILLINNSDTAYYDSGFNGWNKIETYDFDEPLGFLSIPRAQTTFYFKPEKKE